MDDLKNLSKQLDRLDVALKSGNYPLATYIVTALKKAVKLVTPKEIENNGL